MNPKTEIIPNEYEAVKEYLHSGLASKLISESSRKYFEQLLAADKEGRCIVLPCAIGNMVVGDTLYLANKVEKRICRCVCIEVRQVEYGWFALGVERETEMKYSLFFDLFGKTVFLTRPEAEAALERSGEDD